MNASTIIKGLAQTALLCTCLFVANGVWSKDCVEGFGSANVFKTSASPADEHSITAKAHTGAGTGAEMYAWLHDPALHKGDKLGDYGEDLQAVYR